MTFGPSLDRACAALGIDPLADGLQIIPARALDLPAAPAPSEQAAGGAIVRAWSEQQGIGAYRPTLSPYPLVPTRPALLCALRASDLDGVRAGLLLRYPPAHQLTLLADEQAPHQTALSEWGHSAFRIPHSSPRSPLSKAYARPTGRPG